MEEKITGIRVKETTWKMVLNEKKVGETMDDTIKRVFTQVKKDG